MKAVADDDARRRAARSDPQDTVVRRTGLTTAQDLKVALRQPRPRIDQAGRKGRLRRRARGASQAMVRATRHVSACPRTSRCLANANHRRRVDAVHPRGFCERYSRSRRRGVAADDKNRQRGVHRDAEAQQRENGTATEPVDRTLYRLKNGYLAGDRAQGRNGCARLEPCTRNARKVGVDQDEFGADWFHDRSRQNLSRLRRLSLRSSSASTARLSSAAPAPARAQTPLSRRAALSRVVPRRPEGGRRIRAAQARRAPQRGST